MSHSSFRGSGRVCVKCDRFLQDPYLYCSLSCKVYFPTHIFHHFNSILLSGSLLFSPKFTSCSCMLLQVHHHLETANSIGNCELPEKPTSESLSEIEEDDHDQTTRDSVLNSPVSISGSASASAPGGGGGGVGAMRCKTVACSTVTTEFVKMKRSSLNSVPRGSCRLRCSPAADIALALNRRKGVPHRSPLNWMRRRNGKGTFSILLLFYCFLEFNVFGISDLLIIVPWIFNEQLNFHVK